MFFFTPRKWRETKSPAVQTPTRRGFGSVIIERVVPFDLKGKAQVRYEPAGFEADFFIPEEHIAPNPGHLPMAQGGQAAPGTEHEEQRPLEGMTVLLLEDNLILALETEDLLRGLGAQAVLLAGSIDAAKRILEDVHVGIDTSLDFAVAVRDARIPYIFATGYGENVDLGPLHSGVSIVSKPYGRLNVTSMIARELGKVSDTA